MRSSIWWSVIPGLLIALLVAQPHGYAAKASLKSKPRAHVATMKPVVAKVQPYRYAAKASPKSRPRVIAATVEPVVEKKPGSVQIVTFPDTEWHPVKIVRGVPAKDTNAEVPPAEKPAAAELVTFADPKTKPVRVLRGDGENPAAGPPPQATGMRSELVAFADPRFRPVTVLRGSLAPVPSPAIGLFGPAREADLDRVAFAVEGAESSHGRDPRMWSPEWSAPQGPMQVSAAAATDVGGGNRFDIFENRTLGRGYLALMYRRYGKLAGRDRRVQLGSGQHGCVDRQRAPEWELPRRMSSAIAIACCEMSGSTARWPLCCSAAAGGSRRSPSSTLDHGERSRTHPLKYRPSRYRR